MANWLVDLLSGNYNEKQIRNIQPLVQEINELSDSMDALSDDEVKSRSFKLKETISKIDLPAKIKNKDGDLILPSDNSPLDPYLSEAFALVKQACKRLVGTSYTVK